jgi:membrane protein YdbS with pleckstrin-like domain
VPRAGASRILARDRACEREAKTTEDAESAPGGEAVAGRGPGDPVAAGPAPVAPREFRLHPHVLRLWFWQAVITAGVVCVPAGLGVLVTGRWLAAFGAFLAFLLLARLMVLHGRAFAARFRCALLPDGLLVARGVWWRSETFVPRARIQHTEVRHGPIGRHFGIATLRVFTAGSQVGVVEVEGLAREDALALRDALLGRYGHDAL